MPPERLRKGRQLAESMERGAFASRHRRCCHPLAAARRKVVAAGRCLRVATALSAIACSPADPQPPSNSAEPQVWLGTGESEFQWWEGTPQLPLSAGAQGGFHLWLSFVSTGLVPYGPNDNLLELDLTTIVESDPDSELPFLADLATRAVAGNSTVLQELEPRLSTEALNDPSLRGFAGYPAQILNAACAHGQAVRVELTVRDAQGLSASASGRATVAVPVDNRRQDCP